MSNSRPVGSNITGYNGKGKGKEKNRELIADEEQDAGFGGFFKIIYLPFVQNGCFGIPKKFIRLHGEDLCDNVVLQVPHGLIWKVELSKDKNGLVYFNKGLSEFLDYYLLKNGDFLTFTYKGKSNFHVLIFNMSGCEIDYDNPSSHNQVSNDEKGKGHENLSDEDYIQITSDDDNDNDYVSSSGRFQMMNIGNGERSTMEKNTTKKKSGPRRRSATSIITRDRADSINKEFKSQHPFFTVPIQSAYFHHTYLPIPVRFEGRHIMESMTSIKVEVADGRSWPLSIIPRGRDLRLSRGVVDFINDNDLEEGHICVFEMIKKFSEYVLKAHIYRP